MSHGLPPSPGSDPGRLSLELLEARLRALPPPAVPQALSSKLVAAIPPAKAAASASAGIKTTWRWVAGVGAACITVSVAIYSWVVWNSPPAAQRENRSTTGNSATEQNQPGSKAIRNYEEAVRVDPFNANAWFALAKAQAEAHRKTEAIASAEKAIDVARSRNMGGFVTAVEAWLRTYRGTAAEK